MLAVRQVPPKKFPRVHTADDYFCLAVQYVMLGKVAFGLKAATKAVAGHSALGRQFIALYTSRGTQGVVVPSFNKGQYFLVYSAIFGIDMLVSIVVPIVKTLWSIASVAPDSLKFLNRQNNGKTDEKLLHEAELNSLPRAISRTTIPQGLTAEAYLELGKQYKQKGWIGQSQQSLELAISQAPVDSPTAIEAAKYLKTKVPRAQVSLEVEMENLKGYHAMAQGKLSNCKEIFGKLMTEIPEFEWPYLNLASAYIRDNQLDEAKFLLRKLLSINPDHVEAWYSLARIHVATFELEEARQALEHARSLYTDNDDSSLGTTIECLLVLDDDTKLHDRAAQTNQPT